jgi:hypothetical protein
MVGFEMKHHFTVKEDLSVFKEVHEEVRYYKDDNVNNVCSKHSVEQCVWFYFVFCGVITTFVVVAVPCGV